MLGPLVMAAVLAHRRNYHEAFAILLTPVLITIGMVLLARRLYPRPQDLDTAPLVLQGNRFPTTFWVCLAGAALVAAGFADYPLIAYHLSRAGIARDDSIAVFYAVAMAVSGGGSLFFGRLFDRFGFTVLIGLTLLSALFAPLVFLGGFWGALAGAAVWGLGMGVHESIIPAAVAPMVPVQRRASAFGMFTAGYGIFWFIGSAAIGALYDISLSTTIAFCILAELASVPLFIWVGHRQQSLLHT